jgi:hypothetical protein
MWLWNLILNAALKFWKPISVGVALLGLYYKGRKDQEISDFNKQIQEDLETMKRLHNVQVNTDRDSALSRLRKSGNVRD